MSASPPIVLQSPKFRRREFVAKTRYGKQSPRRYQRPFHDVRVR